MHSLIDHLHLPTKYYNTQYQYKCAIAMIWGYGILYLQFGATLHVNKGLIKNSVIFKIVEFPLSLPSYQWSVPQGAQSPQTLYYIILYYIILYYITLFYGFNTLVFCNLHCIYIPPPMPVEYLRQLVIEKDHQCKLQ